MPTILEELERSELYMQEKQHLESVVTHMSQLLKGEIKQGKPFCPIAFFQNGSSIYQANIAIHEPELTRLTAENMQQAVQDYKPEVVGVAFLGSVKDHRDNSNTEALIVCGITKNGVKYGVGIRIDRKNNGIAFGNAVSSSRMQVLLIDKVFSPDFLDQDFSVVFLYLPENGPQPICH